MLKFCSLVVENKISGFLGESGIFLLHALESYALTSLSALKVDMLVPRIICLVCCMYSPVSVPCISGSKLLKKSLVTQFTGHLSLTVILLYLTSFLLESCCFSFSLV